MTLFETSRLRLRELNETDLHGLFEIFSDVETMRYYPRTKTLDETRKWIDWNKRLYSDFKHGLWAIEDKNTGKFIGECGLVPQKVNGADEVELGYHVNKQFWGQGYAPEAAVACCTYGFEILKLQKLISIISPENKPSVRVAEKIGMSLIMKLEMWGRPNLIYSICK